MAEAAADRDTPYQTDDLTPSIGSEVQGIDLGRALDDATVAWLAERLMERVTIIGDRPA